MRGLLMKTVTSVVRGLVVVVAAIAPFLGENSAKGHVVPRQTEMLGRHSTTAGQLNRRDRQPIARGMDGANAPDDSLAVGRPELAVNGGFPWLATGGISSDSVARDSGA